MIGRKIAAALWTAVHILRVYTDAMQKKQLCK